jgi:hypothetical protein
MRGGCDPAAYRINRMVRDTGEARAAAAKARRKRSSRRRSASWPSSASG